MNQYIVGAIGLWMIMVLTGLNHAGQHEGGTSSPGYYWINPDGFRGRLSRRLIPSAPIYSRVTAR